LLNYGLWQPKKKIRKHFGYTQKDMGEMLYISANAYSKKERSEAATSEHNIRQLAAIYGLSPEVLESDCPLEFYTDDAGKPAVRHRKEKSPVVIGLLGLILEYIKQKDK